MKQEELKKLVGYKAATFIENGMIVGLGTGSTVKYLVEALGARVAHENLKIIGVATSKRTADQATSLGIEIKALDDVDHLDLTIDGADEIDEHFQGIKGGGAAHLWEKIVAINSTKNIWIVDESKMVKTLGSFPLPLEVIPFGSHHVIHKLENLGYAPKLRMRNNEIVLTDSKNYVVDLYLKKIPNPHELAMQLDQMVGIVEHGLFLDIVNTVIIGQSTGVKVINDIR
ncbi:ribose-5-phosphate isomerase RpiA [Periweissella beninensis]|uniref:Ribose-5-phosphate isomerase A n=1 Tax=Periweissella beninensis TaxID=504936 RepID=A0ABT0VJ28_9LACO|nr:ribose-5-phosphate isomerase RpiA [Periweissella beninensis]MBM7544602.1 ribose 5-phosphate isomerase A [Periweissella beninensis]MCM2436869.1 ribose-5-phosphate isomerase RpiA [Periweissella beninensis]MCT4395873.1 ribose-5-phosphate isomerase RpiA [Periweissella beninensis]